MTLSIYIAGAWIEQHQRARPMIAHLREAGITVSRDWTQPEGDVCSCGHHRNVHRPEGCGGPRRLTPDGTGTEYVGYCPCPQYNGIGVGSDSLLTTEQRFQHSVANLAGVLNASVVWLLAANSKTSTGAWVELGAALATRLLRESEVSDPYPVGKGHPIIIVSGAKWNRTIFTELADKHFDTDEEAFAHVLTLRDR